MTSVSGRLWQLDSLVLDRWRCDYWLCVHGPHRKDLIVWVFLCPNRSKEKTQQGRIPEVRVRSLHSPKCWPYWLKKSLGCPMPLRHPSTFLKLYFILLHFKGLWKPCIGQVYHHFSNSVCSLCVSVSDFGEILLIFQIFNYYNCYGDLWCCYTDMPKPHITVGIF